MNDHTPAPDADPNRQFKRQLWWGLLWLLLLAGLYVIFIDGLPWRLAVKREIAAIKARGEPTCLADLKPPPVPPEENGALILEELWKKIPHDCMSCAGSTKTLSLAQIQALLHGQPGTPALSEDQRKALSTLQKLLEDQPDLLEKLEAVLAKPHCQFTHDWTVTFYAALALPELGCVRTTCYLLCDLERLYRAQGENAKAQRCRLALLRFPQTLRGKPQTLINALVEAACIGITLDHLQKSMADWSDAELATCASQHAPAPLQAQWAAIMKNARILLIESASMDAALLKKGLNWPSFRWDDWNTWIDGTLGQVYYYTFYRHYDLLKALAEYQAVIDDKPLPASQSYIGQLTLPDPKSIKNRLAVADARWRMFRLGLELERRQRLTGLYPADLSGISLDQLDPTGKPISYQVSPDGRSASLKFPNPFHPAKPHHFELGIKKP